MQLRNLAKLAALGMTLSTLGNVSYALPSAEDYVDISVLVDDQSNSMNGDQPIILKDTDDPKLVYLAYDEVKITDPNTGRNRFGLVYNEKDGGMLNVTVRAGYSENRMATIKKLKEEGYRVAPLAPISGGWSLSISDKNETYVVGAFESIKTVLPDNSVAISIFLKPSAMKMIVTAYNTGASLGLNYLYTYRAVLTPLRIKASINWASLQTFIQQETKIQTKMNASACSFFCIYRAKASLATTTHVRKIVKTAIERQYVKVHIVAGGGTDSEQAKQERIIDEVTKIVLAKVFKPSESNWKPLDLNIPEPEVSEGGGWFSFNFGASIGYLYNSEVIYESKYYDYNIISQGIVNLNAVVGSNFGYLCKDHPELFINMKSGENGCPTKWEDDGQGIVTHLEPGAPQPNIPQGEGAAGDVVFGNEPEPTPTPNK